MTKWWRVLVLGGAAAAAAAAAGEGSELASEMAPFVLFDEWKREREPAGPRVDVDPFHQDLGFFPSQPPKTKKFNYASVDCAAAIVDTNPEATNPQLILRENKDLYLLNECGAGGFVVVELCADILIESVVVGNYEFFSSTFRQLRVLALAQAGGGWAVLGEFEAANVRDAQVFSIANPQIWAKFLKLEVLLHYGTEFYCPISILRVHGKTMMDQYKEETLEDKKQQPEDPVWEYLPPQIESLGELCPVVLPAIDIRQLQGLRRDDVCGVDPEPTVAAQDSVYKAIVKRLNLLENNALLSMLYIEEQSRQLQVAFSQLEQTHRDRFESLVAVFNQSVLEQFSALLGLYLEFQHRSTRILVEHSRDYEAVVAKAGADIRYLQNQLTFQHRMTVFNTLVIVLLVMYVMVTREGDAGGAAWESDAGGAVVKGYWEGRLHKEAGREVFGRDDVLSDDVLSGEDDVFSGEEVLSGEEGVASPNLTSSDID